MQLVILPRFPQDHNIFFFAFFKNNTPSEKYFLYMLNKIVQLVPRREILATSSLISTQDERKRILNERK